MIIHYLKVAWRNLHKYKIQTIISVLGLTIGVVFFAYGYHWYQYETSYDSFYHDSDRIYRVTGKLISTGKQIDYGQVPYIAAGKLEQSFPEIESKVILYPTYGSSFKHGDRKLDGYPRFEFVDENFFRMFPPQVITGNVHENSLLNSDEMIITESYAKKHFGSPEKALGETLISGYNDSYVIRAVIADPPVNSIFQREGYLPDTHGRSFYAQTDEKTQWKDLHNTQLYVKLNPHTNLKNFRDKLSTFAVDNRYNDDLLLELIPLSLVRFSVHDYGRVILYDLKYIRMFIFAGILLLFAAFFNYLNILLSNTIARLREINLRRVTGASVANIYRQLLIEISLFVVIVALISFCCIEITTGFFERIFGTVVSSSALSIVLLSAICLTAILLYITTFIFLYRFIKKSALKEEAPGKRRFVTGRITLSLQLVISAFAIMSAFVLWRQVFFMNHVDWGFDTKNLLQVRMEVDEREAFMEEIGKLPMVEKTIITSTFSVFPSSDEMGPTSLTGVEWDNKPIDFSPLFQMFEVDDNFVEGLQLQILKGRNIGSEDFIRTEQGLRLLQTDKVLINETAQRVMEMDNPIGQKIVIPTNWVSTEGRGREEYEIVGVVKDFHSMGLQSEISPLIIKGIKQHGGFMNYVRVRPGTEEDAIKAINALIPKFGPDDETKNLVQTMGQLLSGLGENEKRLLNLFTTLASLCILISIFGIYSVSQRETQRRQKEIAIRKTAGAYTKEIMAMFFREYIMITLIACVVALPLAWIFMEHWLENFAYRITISWWMFLLVIIVIMIIVSVTIISQVIRAAGRNPAEVVKSE